MSHETSVFFFSLFFFFLSFLFPSFSTPAISVESASSSHENVKKYVDCFKKDASNNYPSHCNVRCRVPYSVTRWGPNVMTSGVREGLAHHYVGEVRRGGRGPRRRVRRELGWAGARSDPTVLSLCGPGAFLFLRVRTSGVRSGVEWRVASPGGPS